MRGRIFSAMSQDWLDCCKLVFLPSSWSSGPGHTVADGKIYRYGFRDFQEKSGVYAGIRFCSGSMAYDRREQLRAGYLC